jgi:hypothetical protein
MTFQEQVQRDAALQASAFEFMNLNEAMKVPNCIVFIYARWSGTAIHSWRTLTSALAQLDRLPRILVVDADEFQPASTTELIGELPQGKGETFWLREGQIVATLAGYREGDAASLIEHTKRLAN